MQSIKKAYLLPGAAALLLPLLLLAGCSSTSTPDAPALESNAARQVVAIEFAAAAEGRSVQAVGTSLPADAEISVSCVRHTTDTDTYAWYFKNDSYSLADGFEPGKQHSWWREPSTEYNFYAFYPVPTPESLNFDGSAPILTHTADSVDLLASEALSYASDYENTVFLTFRHLLAGIRLKATDTCTAGCVTALTLSNVYRTGIFTNNAWGNYTDFGSATLAEHLTVTTGQPELLAADKLAFVAVPQTLPYGSSLDVTFVDDLAGYTHNFSAPLDGLTIEAGKIYTFTLDVAMHKIEFSGSQAWESLMQPMVTDWTNIDVDIAI